MMLTNILSQEKWQTFAKLGGTTLRELEANQELAGAAIEHVQQHVRPSGASHPELEKARPKEDNHQVGRRQIPKGNRQAQVPKRSANPKRQAQRNPQVLLAKEPKKFN